MNISAEHGSVVITQQGKEKTSNNAHLSPVSVFGCPWEVNAVLQSLKYVSAKDWHGWDKIIVTVTDLGFYGVEPTTEYSTYAIYLSVEAVNDAPVVEVKGFTAIDILDGESSSGGGTISAFLVPTQEDTAIIIYSVIISDVDSAASLSPSSVFLTASGTGRGDGEGRLALHPKVELSLSCTYGMLALGGDHGGLVIEEGYSDDGGQALTLVGSLSNINAAMAEGMVYTPQLDWSGMEMVKVRQSWCREKKNMMRDYRNNSFQQKRSSRIHQHLVHQSPGAILLSRPPRVGRNRCCLVAIRRR